MATQWTAGTTAGQVLTAATMNTIGATWESWTPTVTSGSGSFTLLGTRQGKYTRFQKLVIAFYDIAITTNGTAGTYVQSTLPITAAAYSTTGVIGVGGEVNVGGGLGYCRMFTTSAFIIFNAASGYPGANNARLTGTICYEAA